MGKKFLLFLALTVVFLTGGCKSSGGDDDGGSGADFDSTLYYTRTDIDGFLATLNSKLAKPQMPGTEFSGGERTISTVATYSTSAASWTETNRIGVLLIIDMQDSGAPGNSFTLNLGTADTNAFPYSQVSCATHQTFLAYFPLAGGTATVKAWCSSIGAGMTLTITPVVWFSPQ